MPGTFFYLGKSAEKEIDLASSTKSTKLETGFKRQRRHRLHMDGGKDIEMRARVDETG